MQSFQSEFKYKNCSLGKIIVNPDRAAVNSHHFIDDIQANASISRTAILENFLKDPVFDLIWIVYSIVGNIQLQELCIRNVPDYFLKLIRNSSLKTVPCGLLSSTFTDPR